VVELDRQFWSQALKDAMVPAEEAMSTNTDADSSIRNVTLGGLELVRRVAHYVRAMWKGLHFRYVVVFAASHLIPRFTAGPVIAQIYRLAGFEIGRGSSIGGPLRVVSGAAFEDNLMIGEQVLISTNVTINVDGPVRIENSVSISPFVLIYTATHPIGPGSRRVMSDVVGRSVTIERGSWIGLGSTILPGVTVGHGSIVGAGSVVTSDVPPNTYVEGNPAAVVRSLPWGDR
jgi:acetyltransferase-like isoleucine patch superfamily enzyme